MDNDGKITLIKELYKYIDDLKNISVRITKDLANKESSIGSNQRVGRKTVSKGDASLSKSNPAGISCCFILQSFCHFLKTLNTK